MAAMGKLLSVCLVVVLGFSMVMIQLTSAQAIPKPIVPEFTLKLVEHPYDVPPTYEIDQYTGKTVETQTGYHVENKSVIISVKNHQDSILYNGSIYGFYLDIKVKGHFGNDWKWIFSPDGSRSSQQSQTAGEYTTFSYQITQPDNSQLDFQVERIMGHMEKVWVPLHPLYPDYGSYEEDVFAIDETVWSNIQTISIPDGSVSTSGSPSPTVPEFPITVSLFAVLAAVSLLLIIGKRKLITINH